MAKAKVRGCQWCDCLNRNVLADSWKLPATVKTTSGCIP